MLVSAGAATRTGSAAGGTSARAQVGDKAHDGCGDGECDQDFHFRLLWVVDEMVALSAQAAEWVRV